MNDDAGISGAGRFEHTSRPVLGLGGSGHEWASCLIHRDEVHAIAEERVTRQKYGLGADLLQARSRESCLKAAGLGASSLESIYGCDLVPQIFYFPYRRKIQIINHHLAHAHSAFATSEVGDAAILVADNSGSITDGSRRGSEREVETASMYDADANGIRLVKKVSGRHFLSVQRDGDYYQAGQTSNSLGYLYRTASIALGFSFKGPGSGLFSEDGKTMGLSPYGDDRYVDDLGELITLLPEGEFRCDAHAIDAFIARRAATQRFDERAALAAAVQAQLERVIFHMAEYLHRTTGRTNLCIAGGVGLNSVANGLLARKGPFKHVYVAPAPSDDGISVGCAAYGSWLESGKRPVLPRSAFLGPIYSEEDVLVALSGSGLPHRRSDDIAADAAEELVRGKVIGWFQGRSEFGPRALGNRSILALPRPGFVRDKLNHEMKRREWFRPYAPMVPLSEVSRYFDFEQDSPHMSFVAPVRNPELIPAATHVDNTARLQTICAKNGLMNDVLSHVGRSTGVPIALNTSFNLAGEPIVETPADAIRSAVGLKLDRLVVGNYMLDLTAMAGGSR